MTDAEIAALVDAATAPIPGWEGYYEAGADGSIWSVGHNWRGSGRRALKAFVNPGGYLKVRLSMPDGTRVNRTVHRLVAATFNGPRPPGYEIRHLNGDKLDNRALNLAYGTAQENAADRDAHDRTARGSRNGFAKLTEAQIPQIRALAADGVTQRAIAARFGVNQRTVWRALHGGWAHV